MEMWSYLSGKVNELSFFYYENVIIILIVNVNVDSFYGFEVSFGLVFFCKVYVRKIF